MGTLFNQEPRMNNCLSHASTLADKLQWLKETYDVSETTALELVKLSVHIHDLDVKDEQLAGFGEILLSLKEEEE